MIDEKEAGATAATAVESGDKPQDVLSQPDLNLELPKAEKTPEEREKARQAFQRRQEHKAWRQKLAEMQKSSVDDILSTAKRAAGEEGFDVSNESEKQLKVMAKTIKTTMENENSNKSKFLNQASSETLTQTFKALGMDPYSSEVQAIGSYLFKKLGTDNPDLYADEETVKREMGPFGSIFNKKSGNAVSEAILKKAGVPKPQDGSRVAEASANQLSDIKLKAKQFGISEGKAAKLIELQAKQPSYARRK